MVVSLHQIIVQLDILNTLYKDLLVNCVIYSILEKQLQGKSQLVEVQEWFRWA